MKTLAKILACMFAFAAFGAIVLGIPIGFVVGSVKFGMGFFAVIGTFGGLGYYFDIKNEFSWPWDIPSGAS